MSDASIQTSQSCSVPQPDAQPAVDTAGCAMEWSEEQLVAMARGHDRAAFTELYRRFYPRLIRFLEGRRRNAGVLDAEEIAQEAFTRAWIAIGRFDERYRFSTWLYTIAWRTAIDAEKRARRLNLGFIYHFVDDQPSVESRIAISEQADNIWAQARQLLPRDQFSALWLRYAEELSIREMATILNRPAIGVRVMLHRARAALQAAQRHGLSADD